jgi:diaminohydroxyphosphoribosylaminopyrimidine deaminase/5-amino-6-(5-phosphoribosylamino)uracil reductase
MDDFGIMSIALALARENLGCTAPNPSVGCVIVKGGNIIAEGSTSFGGRPHAETNALKIAGSESEGSTIYVTLEPCSHQGVTPPCVDEIIKAKVKKIFIAVKDPDPRVNGQGIKALTEAGIEVSVGLAEKEARILNEGFFKSKLEHLPLVTLKLATSLDGKIALSNKKSKWITGQKAREYAHELRAENDAILVGIGTVMADDPELTCRLAGYEHKSPIRVVLDSNLSFPSDAKMLKSAKEFPVYIITNQDMSSDKSKLLIDSGVTIISLNAHGRIDLPGALFKLASCCGITRLLVEGGSKIATSFLTAKLVDHLIWISSGKVIGNDGIAAINNMGLEHLSDFPEYNLEQYFALDNDMVRIYRK